MGREATISYEQVAAAADTMKATGSKPTSRAIRERIGNIGSMGTINRHLQAWRAGQERQIASALALPAALQRSILDFMGQELAAARAALESDLAEQQQEAADLATENERQAADIEDKADALTALHAELATLQGRLGQMETDLAAAKDDADRERKAAEAARTELAKSLLRLEAMPRLEADLAALRAELDKERQGRVSAEQQAAVLTAKLEAATDRAAKAEAAAIGAIQEAKLARDATAELRGNAEQQAAVLTAKLEAATDRATKAEAAASGAAQEAKLARDEAAELRGKRTGKAG